MQTELFPDGIIYHNFYNQPQTDLAFEKIAGAYGVTSNFPPKEAALQALGGKGRIENLKLFCSNESSWPGNDYSWPGSNKSGPSSNNPDPVEVPVTNISG